MPSSASSWRELVPGLIAATVLAAIVWVVLRYAQVGALRGDTLNLVAPVSGARGIMKGSEVWLTGVRVGKVRSVEFRPATVDTAARVVVKLEVLRKYAALIRDDSYAQIRTGGTLIGSPVVHISSGTNAGRRLDDGDTLRTQPQMDTEKISSQVALATRHFPEILTNVRAIGAQMGETGGSMGALMGSDRTQLQVVGARAGALARRIGNGQGSIGLAMRDGGAMGRARAAMAGADTLRALLAGEGTSAGRFRRDSTLLREVRGLLDEVSIVRSLLAEPKGTAGRALHDRAAYDQITQLERELSALMADLRKRPFRYVVF
jgi:phospholipid/cholesterol/gamma-HCH transport system substrate-binding protein